WARIFRGKHCFHWSGTAPALSDSMAATTKEACVAAKHGGLMVSCDLNYRRKLWTPEKARQVMTDLMQHVDVLIGTEEDSESVLGVDAKGVDVANVVIDAERYRDWAAELHRWFAFKYVACALS